ncbi:hypothetical protein Syn7502_03660 (plasmid) [Synechococcus sp. PCC 7502]|uniref:hypothetical protein n=1 Tax=Synechococcus sp. PCC 7502 TaxID=1173263 RepID=UPI00029FB548|nr:hypothetical protein [Synechococcus sp. PCC 7502]AFY75482.1 hypothetical protein Syn7502_03660 [Synechococcus sp. PCC 7502]
MNDTLVAVQEQTLTEQKESLSKLISTPSRVKLFASWVEIEGKLVCQWISE